MQLFTSLSQIETLEPSNLREYLDQCYRTLYEDGMGPVFVIVEKTDRVDGPDYAFMGNRGLLSDLYEERDLMPTNDMRSLFKGVLSEHLSIADATLNSNVFPDSAAAPAMQNLIRG